LIFGEFALHDGRVSPFYFNVANAIASGEGFSKIATSLAGYVYANFLESSVPTERKIPPERLFIFGAAYRGIPLSAGVAMVLNDKFKVSCRWGYNRKEEEDDKYTVGHLKEGDSVIMIDDVLTTGETTLEIRNNLVKFTGIEDIKFPAVVAVIDRFEGALALRQDVDVYAVLRIDQLFKLCHDHQWISDEHNDQFVTYFNAYGLVQD